jgi:threonine aldolase
VTDPLPLYSDSETLPTQAMLEAMLRARVGDEQRGTDPTVLELERRVADLLGHEAALFLPSGTMCNAIAIRLHTRPGGDEIVLADGAHPAEFEAGGAAALSGAGIRLLPADGGIFEAAELDAAVRPHSRYAPRTRLVHLEQTTQVGRVWSTAVLDDVLAVARRHGLRAHLDGARLMNAAVAAGVPPSEFARGFDTAWIDFAKSLGAPAGAVLAGSGELIDEAWRYKQMWGGAMRQTGYLAAACLHALDHHVERLAEDHANAHALAAGLSAVPGVRVDPARVETNIVVLEVADARRLEVVLRGAGVDLLALDGGRLRAVTHLGIDRAAVDQAIERIANVLSKVD